MYTKLWFLQLWIFCGLAHFLICAIRESFRSERFSEGPVRIGTKSAFATVVLLAGSLFGGPVVLVRQVFVLAGQIRRRTARNAKETNHD